MKCSILTFATRMVHASCRPPSPMCSLFDHPSPISVSSTQRIRYPSRRSGSGSQCRRPSSHALRPKRSWGHLRCDEELDHSWYLLYENLPHPASVSFHDCEVGAYCFGEINLRLNVRPIYMQIKALLFETLQFSLCISPCLLPIDRSQ